MTVRKPSVLFLLVTSILVANSLSHNRGIAGSDKTEVLVVGTIHQRHSTDTNYTYRDLYAILSQYDPDVVCVEIRQKEFRKEPYLPEMTMATIWAISHGKKVYPIDWYREDTRAIRDSLMALPDYKTKEQQVEALEKKDNVIVDFEKKYGTWREQGQKGYEFWNGPEYNEYTMRNNQYWLQVFGDGPITLYYRTRNDSMMALILSAIREKPTRRAIVLTGAEHKHYFDRVLEHTSDVSLIQLTGILPLKKYELDPAMKALLDEADDLVYYEKGYPQDLNSYNRMKIIPLLHGANMDEYPETVPAKNIQKAERVIDRWMKDTSSSSASDLIRFELGWLNFLKGDYHGAIGYLVPLSRKVDARSISDPFLLAATHRNLGLCYDCLGERDSAIACYTRGEELAGETPFKGAVTMLFKNYKTQPYKPGHH